MACYGWDWHPRVISQGLWDDVELVIQPRESLSTLEASYVLSDDLMCCRLKAEAHTHADCIVRLRLMDGETIDLNQADEYELRRLPGIGEKRARDIVAYREEHGPFQSVEDLDKVSGIGPGILSGLVDYVTVGSTD